MDEREFQKELEQAKYLQKCDDRHQDYWMGFILGLHRGYHGENFQCEYDALMADNKRKGKGEGFRDGLDKVKYYERKTWPVVFAVHHGISRYNPDGSERCGGDYGFAGTFDDLDKAIKVAKEMFDSDVQEMKCHYHERRKEEQAFAYITPMYELEDDEREEAEWTFLPQETKDKLNSVSFKMNGCEIE
jgi:hypothetical protein